MALIDVLIKEIGAADDAETVNKISQWVDRCRSEGLSIYALEILLQLKTRPVEQRSMARFTSTPYQERVYGRVVSDPQEPNGATPSPKPEGKFKNFIKKIFGK